MLNNKATGVIEDLGSIRVYDYDIVCGVSSDTFPVRFSLSRDRIGTIKDQGYIGACVAEAISGLAEVLNGIVNDKQIEMSEGAVYGGLRKDNDRSPGMLIETTLKLWMEKGIPPKAYLPELYEMPEMKKWVANHPTIWELPDLFKIEGYVALRGSQKNPKDRQIKDALTKYTYPVIAISNNYFGSQPHCILVTGWDDETDEYEIKNSWGESYGDKGVKNIPKSEIDYAYCVLVEKPKLPFDDVNLDSWYGKAVKNLCLAGLMKGTSETTFEPEKFMTRAEVAVLIDRILSAQEKTNQHLLKMIANRVKEDVEE